MKAYQKCIIPSAKRCMAVADNVYDPRPDFQNGGECIHKDTACSGKNHIVVGGVCVAPSPRTCAQQTDAIFYDAQLNQCINACEEPKRLVSNQTVNGAFYTRAFCTLASAGVCGQYGEKFCKA